MAQTLFISQRIDRVRVFITAYPFEWALPFLEDALWSEWWTAK